MSIANLSRSIDRIKQYRSSAFVASHATASTPTRAGITWKNFGEIRDASFGWEPINTSPSTTGKTFMVGATVTSEFTLMQTGDAEFDALDTIITQNPGGSWFKFTDNPCSDPDTGSGMAGLLLENCGVSHSGQIDLGGGESGIVITITGVTSVAGLAALGTPKSSDANYKDGERVLTFSDC